MTFNGTEPITIITVPSPDSQKATAERVVRRAVSVAPRERLHVTLHAFKLDSFQSQVCTTAKALGHTVHTKMLDDRTMEVWADGGTDKPATNGTPETAADKRAARWTAAKRQAAAARTRQWWESRTPAQLRAHRTKLRLAVLPQGRLAAARRA